MVNRDHILREIRRTADENGGSPLGKARFETETGIREHEWRGRYWARWNDALADAGLPPNQLQGRFDADEVLSKLVAEIRRLRRMPTVAELSLRRREDATFPSPRVFERFGPKASWAQQVLDYCRERDDCADVVEIMTPLLPSEHEPPATSTTPTPEGFVYLLKSGRHYKIGRTFDVGRRKYDLAIQLPEAVSEEHAIRTDDPSGIERYWHTRFADRRKNGEWFELTRADVTAFKRRKFM